jgi:hypothetical protein
MDSGAGFRWLKCEDRVHPPSEDHCMSRPSSPLPGPAPAITARRRVAGGLLAGALAATTLAEAQSPRPAEGRESPQAVVAAMQQAASAHDWGSAFALMLPARRHELATPLVEGVLLMIAMGDPDSPIAGPLAGPEKAKRRKAYTSAVTALRTAWRPFGLDGLVGRPPLAPETLSTMPRRRWASRPTAGRACLRFATSPATRCGAIGPPPKKAKPR